MTATSMPKTAPLPPRDARMECKICWQVYDPVEGDPVVWQIPPGTPFVDLPAHWTCPNCAATKDQFLILCDDEAPVEKPA